MINGEIDHSPFTIDHSHLTQGLQMAGKMNRPGACEKLNKKAGVLLK